MDVRTKQAKESEWLEIMNRDIMMKKTSSQADNYEDEEEGTASMGTVVTCNLKGYFLKRTNLDSTEPASSVANDIVRSNDDPFEILTNQKFKIGEGDCVPGLELALRHLRQGETCTVRATSRFAFGYVGRPALSVKSQTSSSSITIDAIPANCDLEYEVEVLKLVPEGQTDADLVIKEGIISEWDPQNMSYSEEHIRRVAALSELLLRKDAGNRWFSYKDFDRAAKCYSKGTKVADDYFQGTKVLSRETESNEKQDNAERGVGETGVDDNFDIPNSQYMTDSERLEARAKAVQIRKVEKEHQDKEIGVRVGQDDQAIVSAHVSCLGNLSACYLVQGQYLKAKDMCVKVLELDSLNMKALTRAAKAALQLHEYEECDVCLRTALDIDPNNAIAKETAAQLEKSKKAYKAKTSQIQKHIANKMFPSSSNGAASSNSNNNSGNSSSNSNSGNSSSSEKSNNSSTISGSDVEGKGGAASTPAANHGTTGTEGGTLAPSTSSGSSNRASDCSDKGKCEGEGEWAASGRKGNKKTSPSENSRDSNDEWRRGDEGSGKSMAASRGNGNSTQDGVSKVKAKTTGAQRSENYNLVLLLGTSIAVLLLSILIIVATQLGWITV